jgi:ubiquinone/menaquinone biosynthesis C-methylase UbiE
MTVDDIALWETAYCRFETPEEEIRKFTRRLRYLRSADWSRELKIVELFCGRGSGLYALERLGFSSLEGVDLSSRLAESYKGRATIHLGDCRQLPFEDHSRDILIVQGGLHHLSTLPDDLDKTLSESRRVLKTNGRFILVEPWQTPFLHFVHALCRSALLRRLYPKIDALATMIQYERNTYESWLNRPELVLSTLHTHFDPYRVRILWGKVYFLGKPR